MIRRRYAHSGPVEHDRNDWDSEDWEAALFYHVRHTDRGERVTYEAHKQFRTNRNVSPRNRIV